MNVKDFRKHKHCHTESKALQVSFKDKKRVFDRMFRSVNILEISSVQLESQRPSIINLIVYSKVFLKKIGWPVTIRIRKVFRFFSDGVFIFRIGRKMSWQWLFIEQKKLEWDG